MAKHAKATKKNKVVAGVMAFMIGLTTGTSGVAPVNSPEEFPGQFNESAVVEPGRVKAGDNKDFECKQEGYIPGVVLKAKPGYAAVHAEDLVNYSVEERRCIDPEWVVPGYTILIDNEHRVNSISNEWIETVRDDA